MFPLISFAGADLAPSGVILLPAIVLIIMAIILALVFSHSKKKGKERLESISKMLSLLFLFLGIIFGVLGFAAITGSPGRREKMFVVEAQENAVSCYEILDIKEEPVGENWTRSISEEYCEGICEGNWIDHNDVGVVEKTGEDIPGDDITTPRDACLAGLPDLIIED